MWEIDARSEASTSRGENLSIPRPPTRKILLIFRLSKGEVIVGAQSFPEDDHARSDQILHRRGLGRAASPKPFDVVDPATETAFARISLGTAADVDRAVAAARKAFETWSISSRDERLALLRRIKSELERRYDDLVDAITSEMGAPLVLSREAQAAAGVQHLDETIRVLKDFAFEETNGRITLMHEPIGVCGLITPWNWPINQIALQGLPRARRRLHDGAQAQRDHAGERA